MKSSPVTTSINAYVEAEAEVTASMLGTQDEPAMIWFGSTGGWGGLTVCMPMRQAEALYEKLGAMLRDVGAERDGVDFAEEH